MNISDEQIGQLIQLSAPLAMVVALINEGTPQKEHFAVAKTSVLQITQIMRTLYPFSLFEFPADGHDIRQIFSDEYIKNAVAYINAAHRIGASAAMDEQYKKGVGVIKLISVLAQLGSTLLIFKQSMIKFAHKLHDSKRTPDGYAATFAEYFVDLQENPTWMQLTNATVQYASAIMPKKSLPQLVKRMHYVSFVIDVKLLPKECNIVFRDCFTDGDLVFHFVSSKILFGGLGSVNPPYTTHFHKKPPFLFHICIQNTYGSVDAIIIIA